MVDSMTVSLLSRSLALIAFALFSSLMTLVLQNAFLVSLEDTAPYAGHHCTQEDLNHSIPLVIATP